MKLTTQETTHKNIGVSWGRIFAGWEYFGVYPFMYLQVFVDFLCSSVLLQQSPEDTHTTNPEDLDRHTGISCTLSLTSAAVTTLPTGDVIFTAASPGVNCYWLADNETILGQFSDVLTWKQQEHTLSKLSENTYCCLDCDFAISSFTKHFWNVLYRDESLHRVNPIKPIVYDSSDTNISIYFWGDIFTILGIWM